MLLFSHRQKPLSYAMRWVNSFIILISLMISGCANKNVGADNLRYIRNLGSGTVTSENTKISPIRLQALQETALSLGARGGLAWRGKQLNDILKQRSKNLNRIYDFNSVLLESAVLPPVLVEGRNTLNVDGSDVLRLSDRTYQIIKQARFTTATPSWRDYLEMHFSIPDVPDNTLLPRNSREQKAWAHFIEQGWQQGIEQANTIFNVNLGRLKRDYEGMALYRKLLAQNMVSAPFVARSDLGITGDANEMHVNDKILRITAKPALQPEGKAWQPALIEQPSDSPDHD